MSIADITNVTLIVIPRRNYAKKIKLFSLVTNFNSFIRTKLKLITNIFYIFNFDKATSLNLL